MVNFRPRTPLKNSCVRYWLHATIDQSQFWRDFTQSYPSIILNHFFRVVSLKNLAGRSLPYCGFRHPVCLIEKCDTISLHVICSLLLPLTLPRFDCECQMRTHSLPTKIESRLVLPSETNFLSVLPFQSS
ncbi:hypothetical protein TNCV_4049971 [Trichonephila clavipes]|nr:hypothetical protein TNCV_4049971 [Trichonephila clavipes]